VNRPTSNELRTLFIDFFKDRGHPHLPMAPLVPLDDPTLLFTSAGMVPFKPYFSSPLPPPTRRAVTVQRCLRLTDIENVGVTVRHATFFEMLGNFSFGDYFKKEAVEWAWEFSTQVLKMPPERLWPSVYQDDQEAFDLWAKHIGLGADRVTRLGDKDNFWGPAGGAGACGPCSEIYWDQGPGTGCQQPGCAPGCDCERYLEFWNLVFPQFDQAPTGERKPLANRGIDTGMGLERLAMILQGAASVYDNDLLRPIGDATRRLGTPKEADSERGRFASRVITDHLRALVFTFAEGVRPGNEGRDYVVRRLLRRASRLGRYCGIQGIFLARLVPTVVKQMSAYEEYAYLAREEKAIAVAIEEEESRFAETLEQGMSRFEDTAADLETKKQTLFPGAVAFTLYDTYGFPIDLTAEMAKERGFTVDMPGYESAMEEQRERARASHKFQTIGGRARIVGPWQTLSGGSHSEFVGYEQFSLEPVTLRDVRETGTEPRTIEFTLDRTPFYAEGGGQVGDTGWVESIPGSAGAAVRLRVVDTVKDGERILHRAEVVEGTPGAGPYRAAVDAEKRSATQRNHTATHLLHAALRARLGTHLKQAGSLVAPDRLRFDFSHGKGLTPEDLHAIESAINERILADIPVATEVTSLKEAQAKGAMALFGEKYGERVRQVTIGDYSRELCGGCHVGRTGEIGYLRIESEQAVASGTRRVEAVTGALAYQHAEHDRALLRELAARLSAPRDALADRIGALQDEAKRLRDAQAKLSQQATQERLRDAVRAAREEAGRQGRPPLLVAKIDASTKDEMRDAREFVAKELPDGLTALVSMNERYAAVATAVGAKLTSLLSAGDWANNAAKLAGGRGGGKPDRAEAGLKDLTKEREVMEQLRRDGEAALQAVKAG
jgi:alanyl-tRNA synthetase